MRKGVKSRRMDWGAATIHQKAARLKSNGLRRTAKKRVAVPCDDCKLWIEAGETYYATGDMSRVMHEDPCLKSRIAEGHSLDSKAKHDRQVRGVMENLQEALPENRITLPENRIESVANYNLADKAEINYLREELSKLRAELAASQAGHDSYKDGLKDGFQLGIQAASQSPRSIKTNGDLKETVRDLVR